MKQNRKSPVLLLSLVLLFCSCSSTNTCNLPDGYSIASVHESFLEFINYCRVMEPHEMLSHFVDGQEVEVEIRLYLPNQVCVSTNLGEWLAWFELREDVVVCIGLAVPGDNGWPLLTDYSIIDKNTIVISTKREPNYGNSELKNELIAILEEHLLWVVYDSAFSGSSVNEKYLDADVYLSNFYEHEPSIYVIPYLSGHEIIEQMYTFDINETEIAITHAKPLVFSSDSALDQSKLTWLEKIKEYAIRHYVIDERYLEEAQGQSVQVGTYIYQRNRE